jgi:accessory gene regulator B
VKFVLKISFACANRVADVLNENHHRRAIYYYGFYVIFASLAKAVLLVSISLLLGILKPAVLIALIFGSLRSLSGGYHFDTFGRCLFTSLGLFTVSALISQYTFQYWNTVLVLVFLLLIFEFSLYSVIKFAPKDTPNKPITDPAEIMKFKKLSVIYLVVWLTASVILTIYNNNIYAISMGFGVLLEIFTITPQGNAFFNKIKGELNTKSRTNIKNKKHKYIL